MKRLYIGNTTSDTDQRVTKLAEENNTVNYGLITCADDITEDGFYHTTVVDMASSEIAKISCTIIKLDQSKESFSGREEYYQTQELFSNSNNYWQNLVNDNKSFCIFPFISHSLNLENTTLCCRSADPVSKTQDFDWHNSLQDIRNKMLQGTRIENCKTCYKIEDCGSVSPRQSQSIDWARRLDLDSTKDLNFNKPIMYDIYPNNKCNLMCRMCSPDYSVLIQREQNDETNYPSSNWDDIDLTDAQVVYIAGGEPTAMQDFQKFLDRCEQENRLDLEIRVNTNAYKISESLFNKLDKFENIIFSVSIDGYGSANDYQRWKSKWEDISANIQRIVNKGHSVNFNIVVSIYTIFSFYDLVKHLNENYADNFVSIGYPTFENDILNPFVFKYDDAFLDKITSISKMDIYYNSKNLENFVKKLLTNVSSSKLDVEKLTKFFEYNDNLDRLRNSKLQDYIPELEEKRKLLGVKNGQEKIESNTNKQRRTLPETQ
jgi:MoaA/NifB/PqqE/SkfB family radical SAM enzyme